MITKDTNDRDMKTGSQARTQTAPPSTSAAIESIWGLQVFDDDWNALRLYPGLLVPKIDHGKVEQWQGTEMTNQGRWI